MIDQATIETELLSAWLGAESEPLHPELAACFVESTIGPCVKHPLVFSMAHHPSRNRYANLLLSQKRAALAEAEAAGDWQRVVWLHEKPFRPEALFARCDRITDDAEWWRLVGMVWTNSENHMEWGPLTAALLAVDRPGREAMMDVAERAALAAMPETLTVHRGYRGHAAGWSWTTVREVAEQFARRFPHRDGAPRVAHGKVDRRLVVAYFDGESEIVADPADVRVYRTTKLAEATR